ncbi:MAG: class I SAM-dependent methyltransferase [Coriobacteriales bacterium]|jgi:SAM-dependent methyltransferase|nr:class I SAM-dependent methyltransferase [Coriobacteriales bacterium]
MQTLLGVDWRRAWIERGQRRRAPSDSAYWDQRSQEFKEHSGISKYTDTFLNLLPLEPGWSVLDMGTGPGTLAIPLAQRGHPVIAADFSPGMIRAAQERAADLGLDTIQFTTLDWGEDWQAAGIHPKSVDVAVASRSTIVVDLGDALDKLNATARHLAAITMVTEFSPRGFKPRGSVQDDTDAFIPDFIFGVNALFQMGAYPALHYIDTIHGNDDNAGKNLVRWAYIAWKPVERPTETTEVAPPAENRVR